jgi:site-specific DNA recombinase
MGKQAAIYARISSDRTGAGIKVDDQVKDCRALAERLDLTVIEPPFTDDDISAYSGKKRPGYDNLLTAIRAGKVDVVLALHTDRLHRTVSELLDYIKACQPRNVPTYTVRAGDLDLSNATGRAVALTAAVWAAAEVERQIERQKAANLHRAHRGQWAGGRRPFGYERDGVTVIQAEAEALRWSAGQVLSGTSLRQVAAKLNERGIRTATGNKWRPTELARVLVRPRNAGLMVHKGEVVGKAEWPALLDEDLWRGVCAMLGDPSRRTSPPPGRVWLLSGLAVCEVCGQPVRVSTAGSSRGRKVKPSYQCRTEKHVVRGAAEVDAFIEAVIIERLKRPDAAELLAPDQRGDTSALHLKDAALRARLDEQARLHADGVIDGRQLAEGTRAIRAQREQITAQLAAASRGSVLAGVVDAVDPEAVWRGLDLSRRRAIIDVLIEIVIMPTRKGRRPGWKPGETYFDPESVRIEWKR